jgi:zeta-carotene desaturase
MAPDVLIIGAGVAGLSAAVDLSARGKRVLVLEQHRSAGGRTRSFRDESTGDVVDNGQHLLMGCYRHTRRYLQTIGSHHLADLQPSLCIPYLRPGHSPTAFRCPRLPAPFHVLAGWANFSALPISERTAILPIVRALLASSPEHFRALDRISADEWLTHLHQGPEARRYVWDVITIGALNEHPANVSALLLYRVLRTAFFGKMENASLMIPRVGLSALLVDPAIRFIEARGGLVRADAGVSRLVTEGNRVSAAETTAGETVRAAHFISAVPWHALEPLLRHQGTDDVNLSEAFTSSPIVSIQLWFSRPVMNDGFAAVLDRTIQWVFAKAGNDGRQGLSLVISGAGAVVDMEKDRLVRIALDDLAAVIPESAGVVPVHSLVIKERRATFVPRPGLERHRRGTSTALANLFLAGDWTDTGYPATIEGAVMSGFKAAEAVGG